LWTHEGFTLGAEAGAIYGNAIADVRGCDEWGGEARLSSGYSGVRRGYGYYLFSDIAMLSHQDGCVRHRAEFGYGADISEMLPIFQNMFLLHSK
jgi:hypothetical protein